MINLKDSFKTGDILVCKKDMGAHWGSIFTIGQSYKISKINEIKNVIRDNKKSDENSHNRMEEIYSKFGISLSDLSTKEEREELNLIERKWGLKEMELNIEINDTIISFKGDDTMVYSFSLIPIEEISEIYNNGDKVWSVCTRMEIGKHFEIGSYIREERLNKLI